MAVRVILLLLFQLFIEMLVQLLGMGYEARYEAGNDPGSTDASLNDPGTETGLPGHSAFAATGKESLFTAGCSAYSNALGLEHHVSHWAPVPMLLMPIPFKLPMFHAYGNEFTCSNKRYYKRVPVLE